MKWIEVVKGFQVNMDLISYVVDYMDEDSDYPYLLTFLPSNKDDIPAFRCRSFIEREHAKLKVRRFMGDRSAQVLPYEELILKGTCKCGT